MISMKVIKRDGTYEDVSFDKVLRRIQNCAGMQNIDSKAFDHITELGRALNVNSTLIAQKTIERIRDNIHTTELDELASQLSISLVTTHPDYGVLASRIAISNHQRNTDPSFSKTMETLYNQYNPKTGEKMTYLADSFMTTCRTFSKQLDEMICHDRDFLLDYFGFKTIEKQKYLMRDVHGKPLERPQYMWMRVAVALWGEDALHKYSENPSMPLSDVLENIHETYTLISNKYFIHATPTNYNAGSPRPQMSSCYLLGVDDSISGIYKALADCAQISKYAGGIGIHIHNIRSRGSYISGNGGKSTGIVPMLRVFNETARYVDQGSKRNGSIAIYLEPWHADIEDFLKLKLNSGSEQERCRDLFYALWIPDLFMQRVEKDEKWSLFCPTEAPGLADVWGDKFNTLYCSYEERGLARKQVNARDIWHQIITSQIETGTPYMLYKDSVNAKSNQQNIGTIKSSNLCSEITEYSDTEETAVCNLASIGLPTYVNVFKKTFDFDKLRAVVRRIVKNLNRVIDINYYPTPETHRSNIRHRPIGIGIQGLADVFAMMKLAWDDPKAHDLNQRIFEHIYYSAVETSIDLASEFGTYETFPGSPASRGLLQFDLWGVVPLTSSDGSLNWMELKEKMIEKGLRNSLLLAPMPTASTSQILGFTECFEPYTSNIYSRYTLSGEYIVVNKHLIKDLIKLGVWNEDLKNMIIAKNGSIQGIDSIPESIQHLYLTAWEMKQKTLIDMASARGAFICQSQSLNLFVSNPTTAKITSMHIYAWKKGLKTGVYYLRTKAPAMAQKFTIDPELIKEAEKSEFERKKIKNNAVAHAGAGKADTDSEPEICLMCSS